MPTARRRLAGGFQSTDILTAALYQAGSSVVNCNPAVTWYTANLTQTGYGQQQVEVSFTGAQAGALVPSLRYLLVVSRAPVSNSSDVDVVAILQFVARTPWSPS